MVSSGSASPNQTTPGLKRPVLQEGQCGRVEGSMVDASAVVDIVVVDAVILDAARRASSAVVIARDGWKGSSKLFCSM